MSLNIFFQLCSLLLRGGLDLIGYPLASHGCIVLQGNKFCSYQKHLCYLEYFQGGNGQLGCYLVFFDWNIGLQSYTYLQILSLTVSKKSVVFNFYFFEHSSIYISCFVMFWKLKSTFLHIYLFICFWWEKLYFLSNISHFTKFNICIFLFPNL